MGRPLFANWHCFFPLTALLLLGLVAGCGFKIEKLKEHKPEEVKPQGFETPQAAFAALGDAIEENDFLAITQCVTDETAAAFAGGLIISGAVLKATGVAGMEIDGVLRKHDLDASALEDVQKKISTLVQDPESITTLAEPIEDKRLFVADMLQAMHALGRPLPFRPLNAELSQLQVNGDAAIGMLEREEGKMEHINFRRGDVGWQVHLKVLGSRVPSAEGSGEPVAAPAEQDGEPAEPPSEQPAEQL